LVLDAELGALGIKGRAIADARAPTARVMERLLEAMLPSPS